MTSIILYVISRILISVFIVVLLYKTDVIFEYFWWIFYFLKYRPYRTYTILKNDGDTRNFISYLGDTQNHLFIIRLISCPYCFMFWLSLSLHPMLIIPIYIGSLILFKLC